jgi:hypothetical protein
MREFLRAAHVFVQNIFPRKCRADYRAAVGGMWDTIGALQFEFMKNQGLRPEHCLLDIGCGSLRAGRFFITYLNPRCYLGVDGDGPLVRAGLENEINSAIVDEKQPEFVFNSDFQFTFDRKPDFALAQSVLTHLTPSQIEKCLTNLHAFAPRCKFFATFCESSFAWPNTVFPPNTQRTFFYTRGQMTQFAKQCGWSMFYIGDWGHPRGQRMALFTNSA